MHAGTRARPCNPSPLPLLPSHLSAHIPLFLYPFLNTSSKTRPFEYLRLTSLGVIGALVKVRTPPALHPCMGTYPGRTYELMRTHSLPCARRRASRSAAPGRPPMH
jgi:hypothetical protein